MSDRHAVSPYPLRMSAELRCALEEASVRVGRSLHAEILARLESSLEEDRSGVSDEMLESIGLQASLTLSLAKELGGAPLSPEQRYALASLVKVSRRIFERLNA